LGRLVELEDETWICPVGGVCSPESDVM
jgi:hypothetical protein